MRKEFDLSSKINREKIEDFLRTTEFSGYQTVPLPYGLCVPGYNHEDRLNDVLKNVKGKSLLDIGTYYGMFPAEAMRRGAKRAVGIEADPDRYEIARRIANFNADSYEIKFGRLETTPFEEKFDVVLLLNVLHHVLDPIETVLTVASYCQKDLIIEFCSATDPAYMYYCRYGPTAKPTKLRRQIVNLHSRLLTIIAGKLPIMAVGNREYHRSFYLSNCAFYNIFVIHHKIFRRVEFLQSHLSRHRTLAFCELAD